MYPLPPATKLEEQVASQLPNTSHVYVPPYVSTSIPPVLGGYTHSQYIPPLPQPSLLPYVPQAHPTHLPHTMGTYLAPGLIASNGPQAPLTNPLTEAQLRLHNNSLQNDQHFVNPMHNAQDDHFVNPVYRMQQPAYKAPLPETPPNLGHTKNVNRRQESIHSNLSPYSDQGLLGDHHIPSAALPGYQPSRLSRHQDTMHTKTWIRSRIGSLATDSHLSKTSRKRNLERRNPRRIQGTPHPIGDKDTIPILVMEVHLDLIVIIHQGSLLRLHTPIPHLLLGPTLPILIPLLLLVREGLQSHLSPQTNSLR
jgi:hypothetical protein